MRRARHHFDPVVPPQPASATEGGDSALGADARPREDEEAVSGRNGERR